MCGIIGYLGENKKIEFVLNKLKMLEYRGYDSSGIIDLKSNEFSCIKAVSNITELIKKVDLDKEVNCVMAHTRWSTHGKPTLENAHPHISSKSIWAIVHNGIIENYEDIKNSLKLPLNSDTDSAVIPELLEEKGANDIYSFIDVIKMLKGSYGLVCMNANQEDTLYLAKKRNPMYVAIDTNKNILISSDPICFQGFSKSYYTMNDDEFALISKGEIFFYDSNKKIIVKETSEIEKDYEQIDKKDYKHFMIKEIEEQPYILKRLLNKYKEILNAYDKEFIKKYDSVKLIGCGTAYHASMIGAKYFEKILKIPSSSETASEFAYSNPLINNKTLYIFISQSGETADTIKALELVKQKGATTIALTNVSYSLIARLSDYVLPVCAGKEISVASTKAYTAQLAGLYLFVKHFSKDEGFNDIEELAKNIENQDINKIMKIADKIKERNDVIFIGKDFDSVTASEGALKLKETSYINASSYPSGELKHGFLALVEEGTPIIAITTDKRVSSKTMNATNEAVSRGAQAFIITSEDSQKDNVINIKAPNTYLMPISSIIPLQLLAYNASLKRGINPDQPRNLAKSVTVE